MKINSPDYVGIDKEVAVSDFLSRIKHYEEYYDPIDEERDKDVPFIKIFDQGEKFLVNRVRGKLMIIFASETNRKFIERIHIPCACEGLRPVRIERSWQFLFNCVHFDRLQLTVGCLLLTHSQTYLTCN